MNIRSIVKRLVFTAAAGCTMLLCGCFGGKGTPDSSPADLDKMYTAECEITVENSEEDILCYTGVISRMGGGFWELSLASPETVAGLKIKLDSEGITASLGELNFKLEHDKIPSRASFMAIFGALDNAALDSGNLTFSETETELCYYGTYNGCKYTISYNKADNTLSGLNIGNVDVRFSCFTVTGEDNSSAVTSVSEENSVTTVPEATVTSPVTATAPVTTAAPVTTTAPAASTTATASTSSSRR